MRSAGGRNACARTGDVRMSFDAMLQAWNVLVPPQISLVAAGSSNRVETPESILAIASLTSELACAAASLEMSPESLPSKPQRRVCFARTQVSFKRARQKLALNSRQMWQVGLC